MELFASFEENDKLYRDKYMYGIIRVKFASLGEERGKVVFNPLDFSLRVGAS